MTNKQNNLGGKSDKWRSAIKKMGFKPKPADLDDFRDGTETWSIKTNPTKRSKKLREVIKRKSK